MKNLIFQQYALQNLDGNALRDFGGSTDYVTDIVLIHYNDFRDFKIDYWIDKTERKKYEFMEIGVYAESIKDLILNGEGSDLKYLNFQQPKNIFLSFC